MAEAVGLEIGKTILSGAIEGGLPILLERGLPFFKKTQKIDVIFAVVLDYYEMPQLDVAWHLIEKCLKPYRKEGKLLTMDDVIFAYDVSHEIESEYVPPYIEFDDPDYLQTVYYISLSEILFYPYKKDNITETPNGRKIITSGYKLMNAIIDSMENNQEILDTLKIRSKVKWISIKSDRQFIRNLYKQLEERISKDSFLGRTHIRKIETIDASQLLVSLEDSSTMRILLEDLGLKR